MSQQGPLTDLSSIGSDIETLTGDTGGAVGPDGAFNIDILGGDTTTITGNPGTSTLTVDASVSGYPITPYVVGPSGQAGYTTIQDALDAANSAGGGIVGVQPGTYTEDLTLYDATEVVGFGSNSSVNGGATLAPIVITGTHTPPLTGSFVFKNLTLTSAGSVIFSASALGTATINVEGCIIGNISGYLFDLDNWGGGFSLINTINPGLGNRGINNTVGSNVFVLQSELGSFGALSSNLGGTYRFQNATCRPPIAFLDGSDTLFNNGSFLSGFTTAGAADLSVYESLIQHTSSSAITHEGDNEVIVSNCTISSSTNPSIAGSGAGQLSLTGLEFTSNSSLAGTLTIVGGTSYSGTYIADARGYDVNPGSDIDADLITVGVTGTPTFSWDESADGFRFNKGVIVGTDGDLSHTINGAAVDSDIEIHSEDTQNLGGLTIHRHADNSTFGAHIIGLRSNGTHASPTIVTDGDFVSRYLSAGYDGTDYALMAEIRMEVDGTPGNNDMPGRIVMLTSQSGTQTPVEGFRLDESQIVTLANALPVGSGGTGSTTLTDGGILLGSGTGAITSTAQPTNGQLLIGSTGVDPVLATLTSGVGISITEGAGSITINSNDAGMTWTDVTGTTQAMSVDNGYVANNVSLVTLTLPTAAAVGDIVKVDGNGAGGWLIAQNAGQTVHFLSQDTTTGIGGSLASSTRYDCVAYRCVIANTDWVVESVVGNLTVV